jgi:hypothetical protein
MKICGVYGGDGGVEDYFSFLISKKWANHFFINSKWANY